VSPFGLITLFTALGFFAGCLISDKAYYYILFACIPITSAAVRNLRWFYRKAQMKEWRNGAIATSAAYLVFEIAPPVWALTHFFTLGVYEMKVPIGMWIGMVIPGIILTLMTFYYSVLFVRRSF